MTNGGDNCTPDWSSISGYFGSYWHSLTTPECWASAGGVGPVGDVVIGIDLGLWSFKTVGQNWRTITTVVAAGAGIGLGLLGRDGLLGSYRTGPVLPVVVGSGGGIGLSGGSGSGSTITLPGGLTTRMGLSPVDMGRGPGPRQPPRTPGEDPSSGKEHFAVKSEPGGASPWWGAICAAAGVAGAGFGYLSYLGLRGGVNAQSNQDEELLLEGGMGALGVTLCVAWGKSTGAF